MTANASTLPRKNRTMIAAGVIAQFVAVKFHTDGESVVKAGANERAIGIAQSAATASGEAVEVAMFGGGALLKINEAVDAGKLLTPTSDGYGEVADAAGEWCFALALQTGVQNDVIEVEVIACQAQASDA